MSNTWYIVQFYSNNYHTTPEVTNSIFCRHVDTFYDCLVFDL